MGAWSYKPFANDEAEEFLELLQGADGVSYLASTLKELKLRELDDEDECSRAVAASEVVAAAAGYAVPGLPREIRAFLKEGNFILTPSLHKRAKQVASAILKSSGLADLWADSDKNNAWRRSMQSLVDRLGRPVEEGVSKRRVPEAKEKRVASKSPGARSRRSSDDAGRISASAMTKGNKPVSLRDVKSILGKLGGGYAGTVHRNKKLHEVSFSTLRKYPGIKDAVRLATLPNVDWFSVGGEKLSAEKLRILQTLIMGWSQLRTLIATGVTGGFAAWICSHAPLMDSLENLELDGTDVTDADLEALKNCSMLREINLSSTRVTIKGLTSLTQVQSLQRVSICNCDQISIADASKFVVRHPGRFDLSFIKNEVAMGMQSSTAQEKSRHLKQNARVISVFEKSRNAGPNRFFGTTFVVEAIPTPVSLQDMANECCVEKLVIGSYYTGEVKGLTGDDFKFLLTAWPDLRELQIAKIPDSEDVLKETISRLKQLRKLELINTPCGDTVLPAIATLKNLVQLELHGTRITGAGLRLLPKLSKLRWLGLVGNPNLKPDDVDKFRELTVGKMWIDFQK